MSDKHVEWSESLLQIRMRQPTIVRNVMRHKPGSGIHHAFLKKTGTGLKKTVESVVRAASRVQARGLIKQDQIERSERA